MCSIRATYSMKNHSDQFVIWTLSFRTTFRKNVDGNTHTHAKYAKTKPIVLAWQPWSRCLKEMVTGNATQNNGITVAQRPPKPNPYYKNVLANNRASIFNFFFAPFFVYFFIYFFLLSILEASKFNFFTIETRTSVCCVRSSVHEMNKKIEIRNLLDTHNVTQHTTNTMLEDNNGHGRERSEDTHHLSLGNFMKNKHLSILGCRWLASVAALSDFSFILTLLLLY